MADGFKYKTTVNLYPESDSSNHKDDDDELSPCRNMLLRLDGITQNNAGVVSVACKSQLQADTRTRYYFASDHTFILDPLDAATVGSHPDIDNMVDLYECRKEYKQRQMTEAAWNCAMHFPVLDMARKLTPHYREMRVVNM